MDKKQKYNVAFTAASLLINETRTIAAVYHEHKDWDFTRKYIFENRLLQTRTDATAARYFRELKSRIDSLSQQQIDLIVNGSIDEVKQVLWWAVCKRYKYIQDFAVEVIKSKFSLFDYNVSHVDYIHFFDGKCDIDESLNRLTDTTRKKLEQVIFRMLREASILDKKNKIIPVSLGKRVIKVLNTDKPDSFFVFPIPESELRGYL